MHQSNIFHKTELTLIRGGLSDSSDEFIAIPHAIRLHAQGYAQASGGTLFEVLNSGLAWADQQQLSRSQLTHWPEQVEDLLIRRAAIDPYNNLAAFILAQERICSPRSVLGSILGLYFDYEVERHRLPQQRQGIVDLQAYRRSRRGSR